MPCSCKKIKISTFKSFEIRVIFSFRHTSVRIRGSSLSITIRLGGLVSETGTDFHVWNRVRVGSTSSSLILWVSGDLSGLKWLDAMFSSNSQVKYAWNCTYVFPYIFTTCVMKPRDSFAFLSIRCPYFIIDIIFDFLQGVLMRCVPSVRQNSAPCSPYAYIEALEPTIAIQRTLKEEWLHAARRSGQNSWPESYVIYVEQES